VNVNLELARPLALALLALLPLWAVWLRRRGGGAVLLARADLAARGRGRRTGLLAALPDVLRGLAWAALVIAVSGPRQVGAIQTTRTEGISIMLAVDVSSSMLSLDFRPSRLAVTRSTMGRFVAARPGDRIGLVAFAAEALTQVPTTLDHTLLIHALGGLRWGMLPDGTAIGDGLATAVNRLRTVPGRSKVVILMSDGENTAGSIDPMDAARAAKAFGVRVYTIGVGSRGAALSPVSIQGGRLLYGPQQVSIDEALLGGIARTTGGRYFRAADAGALRRIYAEIDRLERSPSEERRRIRYEELYLPFLLAGAALLVAEWLVRGSRWGRVP
jgi:Ca-activated chloride channel family protein